MRPTEKRAAEAKRRLLELLLDEDGFVAVGLSGADGDAPVIVVHVARADSPVVAAIPEEWEGCEVEVLVTGQARKRRED